MSPQPPERWWLISAPFYLVVSALGALVAGLLGYAWWAGGLITCVSLAIVGWSTQFDEW
jgi:hypothetical protein